MITSEIEALVRNAMAEDVGKGDHTSIACIDKDIVKQAELIIKDNGIVAGVELAEYIFHQFDENAVFKTLVKDGSYAKKGDILFTVKGNARKILAAERLVLNCMQRMSGIATSTYNLKEKIKDYKSTILDTRKTTPGFRAVEKWAVRIGGGKNHRFGLYDAILIKDNHIDYAGGVLNAIVAVKRYLLKENLSLKIIVEARNMEEVDEILISEGVDRILLDNFSIKDLNTAIQKIGSYCETEASGGIDETNIVEYAKTGVNFISIGALTHQYRSLDMSLKAI